MSDSFTAPLANGPLDSTVTRAWLDSMQKYLKGVAKVDQTNEFLDYTQVTSEWQGTGLLTVHQVATTSGKFSNNWAIVGWTDMTVPQDTNGTTVGGFFTGRVWKGGGSGWGVAVECLNGTPTTGSHADCNITGGEFAVGQFFDDNAAYVAGVGAVFKNRPDGAAAPFNGLGANRYSNNSRAFDITSQTPSAAGELCGWSVGLMFNTNCMSPPIAGAIAVGIDMSRITYAQMSIALWAPADAQLRLGNTGAHVAYRTTSNSVVISNGLGIDWFGVNNGDGKISISCPTTGTAGNGSASLLPTIAAGYIAININGFDARIPLFEP